MRTLYEFRQNSEGAKKAWETKKKKQQSNENNITAKGLGNSFLTGAGIGGTLGGVGQGLTNPVGKYGKLFHPSSNYGKITLASGLTGLGIYTGKKIYNKIQNRNKKYE